MTKTRAVTTNDVAAARIAIATEAGVEVPPGIVVEREEEEKEDLKRGRTTWWPESSSLRNKSGGCTDSCGRRRVSPGRPQRKKTSVGDVTAQGKMAKMEGCLVCQGWAAELELQTKEADFERAAEVDCQETGRDDWSAGRVEE